MIGSKLKEYGGWHEKLMDKLLCQIARLKEYRQALIVAAVTGQIEIAAQREGARPSEPESLPTLVD